MSNFDYDKIKDMVYDPERKRYIGKDGSEFRVTPHKDGSGYKYDYYSKNDRGVYFKMDDVACGDFVKTQKDLIKAINDNLINYLSNKEGLSVKGTSSFLL